MQAFKLIAVAVLSAISFNSYAADLVNVELTDYQKVQQSKFDLSESEYKKFLEILQGPRAFYTPNIEKNPIFALLLEADNEADRRKYALLYAQLETSNEQKIHQATKAVKEAVKELYGENPKLFAVEETVSTQLASKFSAAPPVSQKPRLSLYIKAIDCSQCDAEFKKAYSGVPSMYSGIDVYFVGDNGDNGPMIAWARAAKLTKDEVLSGKVTINHAEKKPASLPFSELSFE